MNVSASDEDVHESSVFQNVESEMQMGLAAIRNKHLYASVIFETQPALNWTTIFVIKRFI